MAINHFPGWKIHRNNLFNGCLLFTVLLHIPLHVLNSTEIGYAPVWMKELETWFSWLPTMRIKIELPYAWAYWFWIFLLYLHPDLHSSQMIPEALLISPDFFSWFPNFLLAPDNRNLLALPLLISWALGLSHLLQILVSDVISESPYIEASAARSALQ